MISSAQVSLQYEPLRKLYAEGRALARRHGAPVLVSLTYPVPWCDPLDVLRNADRLGLDPLYWSVPSRQFTLIGIGVAHAVEGAGPERYSQVSQGWRQLLQTALIENAADVSGTGPILMGGFRFDPLRKPHPMWLGFPDARLVLPSLAITVRGDEAWLTRNLIVGEHKVSDTADQTSEWTQALWQTSKPSTDAPPDLQVHQVDKEAWTSLVAQVAHSLHNGPLEKVVLARAVKATSDQALKAHQALENLRSTYPDCFLFSFSRGGRTFLGATPEQLIRLNHGQVETMCLAGSIGRGTSPQDDERLGNALLASDKNLHEHQVVLRMMRSGLSEVCQHISHPNEPTLLKLGNVQHLHTPIRARCKDGKTVFDVLQRLHPTPAVGGSPREAAMELIRQREGFDRGWYASPVGWVDAREDGEFAVALRSALLDGQRATLFAGCGIMPDSDPDSEYQESCLKLRPMLHALGGLD